MSKNDAKKGLSRRDFLKGAAVGAGAAALSGMGVKGTEATVLPPRWDKVADVVVVGSGTGLAGALAAAAGGAGVIVLEKMPVAGGSMAMSYGATWIPNNSLMKAAGIPDSRENALTYLRLIAQGQADEELMEAFADKGPEMVDFVMANSPVQWECTLTWPPLEYHPEWPGAVPKGRSLIPVAKDPSLMMRGWILTQGLLEGCRGKGVKIELETPVKRLITRMLPDGRQEVLGIVTEKAGKAIHIKANQGVILAAGGYDWNTEMKKHFLRGPTPYTTGTPGDTGDGILMGMAVGADLRNMNECHGLPVYKEEAEAQADRGAPATGFLLFYLNKPGVILVNRYGERFCNEAADYDSIWRSFFAWEDWGELRYSNLPAYAIMDQTCIAKYGIGGPTAGKPLPAWVKQANTLKDLARAFGIDPEGLDKTISEFNEYARRGVDPRFHRGESLFDRSWGDPTLEGTYATLAPLQTPSFYGAEVACGSWGTSGGLRVNSNAQVLNPFGQVLPRLYCAGNNSGVGAPGASYGAGGGSIGPGLTFAYIAGKHVLTLQPWK